MDDMVKVTKVGWNMVRVTYASGRTEIVGREFLVLSGELVLK
ncbi:hypothetical protein SAMN05443247_03115 [Bradyrhizobium erythrophlei]|nr:hypothetical protein SAMN05443247_03115 [Bradyrhizobium erythrophlei]